MDRQYAAGRLNGVRVLVQAAKNDRRRGASTRIASPSELIGTMVVLAVVFGFVGARVFHILENPGEFAATPLRKHV